jgi:hypothetical protein
MKIGWALSFLGLVTNMTQDRMDVREKVKNQNKAVSA